jgi:hypothetical protein
LPNQSGAKIVINRDDKPVAKLAAAGLVTEPDQTLPRRSLLGLLEGKVIFHEGWEETPEEFEPYME